MLDWMKEHKYYLVLPIVLLILLVYYGYSILLAPVSTVEEENWLSTEEIIDESIPIQEQIVEDILVDVKGAVQKPGVYEAVLGERVIDVIEKAGGVTETADATAINFAMRVSDEMVLYVPSVGEEIESRESTVVTAGSSNSDKININKAPQSELETLPGIGPAKAQAIIEYRETNGPYKSIEDIKSISGFGEKTFEKLKESIAVN